MILKLKNLVLAALLLCTAVAKSQIITTIAGSGFNACVGTVCGACFLGDGGQATTARLAGPEDIAIDTFGNMFISDAGNHRIRKVSASGIITTYAGNGTLAPSGDGGPATAAGFAPAHAIALDRVGNLYVGSGSSIRKIDTAGIVTTFATLANPALGWNVNGLAFDSTGILYATCENMIFGVPPSGAEFWIAGDGLGVAGYTGDGGPATAAKLIATGGICVDKLGNIFFVNGTNIRRITPSGIISTVVGKVTGTITCVANGAATAHRLSSLTGLAIDDDGNLYITNHGCNIVYKVGNALDSFKLIAGINLSGYAGDGGMATAARFCHPSGIEVDKNGNILIADRDNHAIRKIRKFSMTVVGASSLCMGNTTTLIDSVAGGSWTSSNTAIATISSSGIVSAVDTGAVTITYTVGTKYAVHAMTVNPLPYAGTLPATTALCDGDSVLLSATTSGGIWTSDNSAVATVSGAGLVKAIAGGSANISYTVTNMCGSASTVSALTVTSLPPGVISGDSALCSGQAISLAATVAGGSWSSSDNTVATVNISGVVTGIAAGAATITYAATNSCGSGATTKAVTVTVCSIPENQVSTIAAPEWQIFPNPASTSLSIAYPVSIADVTITNLLGQTVLHEVCSDNKTTLLLNISAMPSGNYLVRTNGVDTKLLVKK